ncbi:GGDEF domain-containing protein [Congzhengia minquanensis]|uniref:GGDEF domain-containing protein n=1 Tax=Congzhengia minquanensis TaxID=2763657 RepID=A0A926DPU5_9FIRM|nr:GGDEF domain-containing protein [Congzhengia minquanensis]MBC8541617.1 GGDEF domain-containing protein [Congzhengia minquanensis]
MKQLLGSLAVLQAVFVNLYTFYSLYKKGIRRLSDLAMALCMSLVYSFLVFLLAKRSALFVQSRLFYNAVFLFQTVLYLGSIYFYCYFLQQKFWFLLNNAGRKTRILFFIMSVCWLIFLPAAGVLFSFGDNRLFALAVSLVIGISIVLSCEVFYCLSAAGFEAELFKKRSEFDVTTGLRNKSSFYIDLEMLLETGEPFTIFFMDLDNFKSINDLYGHNAGDRYLQAFSEIIGKSLFKLGQLYRISGDEFIFLHLGEQNEEVIQRIHEINEMKELIYGEHKFPFLGVSYGVSTYPCDAAGLAELLSEADMKMYRQKTVRKENGAAIG